MVVWSLCTVNGSPICNTPRKECTNVCSVSEHLIIYSCTIEYINRNNTVKETSVYDADYIFLFMVIK